jgi:hypothetical protein
MATRKKSSIPIETDIVPSAIKMELSPNSHSWDKRLEVVSRFMLLGNMRLVSEQTKVAYETLMEWKKSDWWPELVDQIKRTTKSKRNNSITAIIEQSIDTVHDRLANGDFVFDQKSGQIIRKPVSARDATYISEAMMKRQDIIETQMDHSHSEDTREEQLVKLAQEFQKWASKTKKVDVVDIVAKEL